MNPCNFIICYSLTSCFSWHRLHFRVDFPAFVYVECSPQESTNRTSELFLNIFAVVFKRSVIESIDLRFDPKFGLGEDVVYKSGEDLLFMHSFLVLSGFRRILFDHKAIVFHRERDNKLEREKIIEYSYGHGRTWRRMLAIEPRIMMRIWLFLLFVMTVTYSLIRAVVDPGLRLPAALNRLRGFVQ